MASENSRPPKILILCAVDFTVRQFLAPLALHLQRKGCRVEVACTRGENWDYLVGQGLTMVHLPIARSANIFSHLLSMLRLFVYLRTKRFDVLHVHTPVAGLLGRITGWLARVPVIIYTAHGFYFHEGMAPGRRRLHVALERIAAKFHDYLFCVSEEDARAAEQLGIEKPTRIFLVRNGAEAGRFDPAKAEIARPERRREFSIPADAPVVSIMGRITREKGFFEFLDAARQVRAHHPAAHFLLIGDTLPSDRDRIRERLEEAASTEELRGHVHFAGMRDDIPEVLAASDIFCLPSYREGLPVSIIEAMMAGLPVVATRIRGCREAVQDGSTGFLIAVRNSKDLAEAVSYLLKHRETAHKMGASGRRRAVELFSLSQSLERQWTIYQRILAERRAA